VTDQITRLFCDVLKSMEDFYAGSGATKQQTHEIGFAKFVRDADGAVLVMQKKTV